MENIVNALRYFGILTGKEIIEKLKMINVEINEHELDLYIQALRFKPALIQECDVLGYYKLKTRLR